MYWALRSAASGMSIQQMAMDVIANNISNVSTPGFKASNARFADLIYGKSAAPTEALSIGTGAKVTEVSRDFSSGILENDGKPTHLAIEGEGFFQVRLPNGTVGYTRSGILNVDGSGNLTIGGGYLLEPPLQVPPGISPSSLTIRPDGLVIALDDQGNEHDIGRVILSKFTNPDGLLSSGGGILLSSEASGFPTSAIPGTNGIGVLRQGCLEKSNTDLAREMVEMISALRAYQLNARIVQFSDEALGIANNIIRG